MTIFTPIIIILLIIIISIIIDIIIIINKYNESELFLKESYRNLQSNKIISFSLWGDKGCYNWGALENALIAQKLFPDWTCRYYIGKGVLPEMLKLLKELPNVEIIEMFHSNTNKMTWRFIPAFETNNIVIIRDADSFLNIRDKAAVDEWLASDKNFHIIRDHENGHTSKIMGGMWGVRNGILKKYKHLIDKINTSHDYGADQDWLNKKIYPNIINDVFIHDEHNHHKDEKNVHKLPKTDYKGFIGEVLCSNYQNIKLKYNINLKSQNRA
tara:strand:- start:18 stop:827 length:810 start_codon:yes stop_codon:yes gene_type:complete